MKLFFGISLECNPVSHLLDTPSNYAENQRLALMAFNANAQYAALYQQQIAQNSLQMPPLNQVTYQDWLYRLAEGAQRQRDLNLIANASDLWRRLDAARARHGLPPS